MHGYPEGLWHGAQGPFPPLTVLGKAEYCGVGGRLLRSTLLRLERGYSGRPTITHYFQYGGRRGGLTLVISAGGGKGGGRKQW